MTIYPSSNFVYRNLLQLSTRVFSTMYESTSSIWLLHYWQRISNPAPKITSSKNPENDFCRIWNIWCFNYAKAAFSFSNKRPHWYNIDYGLFSSWTKFSKVRNDSVSFISISLHYIILLFVDICHLIATPVTHLSFN